MTLNNEHSITIYTRMVRVFDIGGQEFAKVFMAATLAEAKEAEELLTLRGVNYTVEVEEAGRTLFGSPRNVAIISVEASQLQYCGLQLSEAGLGSGVLIDELT